MKNRTDYSDEQALEQGFVDEEELTALADDEELLEDNGKIPTILTESSSGAILKKISSGDLDRPDLGPLQWLVIGALLLKKVIVVAFIVTMAYWLLK